jgi:hypothetical protein
MYVTTIVQKLKQICVCVNIEGDQVGGGCWVILNWGFVGKLILAETYLSA